MKEFIKKCSEEAAAKREKQLKEALLKVPDLFEIVSIFYNIVEKDGERDFFGCDFVETSIGSVTFSYKPYKLRLMRAKAEDVIERLFKFLENREKR